jgi:hypothetical protein
MISKIKKDEQEWALSVPKPQHSGAGGLSCFTGQKAKVACWGWPSPWPNVARPGPAQPGQPRPVRHARHVLWAVTVPRADTANRWPRCSEVFASSTSVEGLTRGAWTGELGLTEACCRRGGGGRRSVWRMATRGRAAPVVTYGEEEACEARNALRFLEQQRGGLRGHRSR